MSESEPQYLYLTTTGRNSGLPREIEIWFTEHGGRYYVIAEHGTRANWVRNIMANGSVQVRLDEKNHPARAQVLHSGQAAEAAKQRHVAKYGWGDGLVVELEPTETSRTK